MGLLVGASQLSQFSLTSQCFWNTNQSQETHVIDISNIPKKRLLLELYMHQLNNDEFIKSKLGERYSSMQKIAGFLKQNDGYIDIIDSVIFKIDFTGNTIDASAYDAAVKKTRPTSASTKPILARDIVQAVRHECQVEQSLESYFAHQFGDDGIELSLTRRFNSLELLISICGYQHKLIKLYINDQELKKLYNLVPINNTSTNNLHSQSNLYLDQITYELANYIMKQLVAQECELNNELNVLQKYKAKPMSLWPESAPQMISCRYFDDPSPRIAEIKRDLSQLNNLKQILNAKVELYSKKSNCTTNSITDPIFSECPSGWGQLGLNTQEISFSPV